jgi:hypothetical protein
MKKLIALILCTALLVCGAAMAETAGDPGSLKMGSFEITYKMPEDYRLSTLEYSNTSFVGLISSEKEGSPRVDISIQFNDEYTEYDEAAGTHKALRLNDVPEDIMQEIKDSFLEQLTTAEFEEKETAHGTKLLIVRGNLDETTPVVAIYTIYQSYEIELVASMGQGSDATLTDAQIQSFIDFLSDMDFNEIK